MYCQKKKSYCWRWLILAAERVFEDSNENGSIDDEVTEMLWSFHHRQCFACFRTEKKGFCLIKYFLVWLKPLPLAVINFVIFLPSSGPYFHLVIRWSRDSNPRPRTVARIVSPWRSPQDQEVSLNRILQQNCRPFQWFGQLNLVKLS